MGQFIDPQFVSAVGGSKSALQAVRVNAGNTGWEKAVAGWLDKAQTWQQMQTFTLGAIVPNSVPYSMTLVDGVSVATIIVNDVNNLTINPENNIGLIACGGSALGHGRNPSLWLHNGGRLNYESYDFNTDMDVMWTDANDNLLIGNYQDLGFAHFNGVIFQVGTGKAFTFTEQGSSVVSILSSVISTRAGLSGGPPLVSVGGSIFDDYATVSSTHTDGTFDDLFTHTVLGSTLAVNGDALSGRIGGSFVGHVGTVELKLVFAGTAIFDTTALVSASNSNWVMDYLIERVSSTVVRYAVNIVATGLASVVPAGVGELTGLTLSSDNILKVTGASASTGAASGDISAKLQKIRLEKAAGFLTFPASLLPYAWYKADAGTYQTSGGSAASANNDPVGSWLDQGLNSRNMSQSTSGFRPLLKTNYQNSLPAILMDGVDDFLAQGDNLATPVSVYMVGKNVSNIANAFPIGDPNIGGGVVVTGGTAYLWTGLTPSKAAATGTVFTWKAVFNGVSSLLGLNGGTDATGNCTAVILPMNLGGNSITSNYANFAFMEVLIFNRLLTAGEETLLIAYLRTRWNHY